VCLHCSPPCSLQVSGMYIIQLVVSLRTQTHHRSCFLSLLFKMRNLLSLVSPKTCRLILALRLSRQSFQRRVCLSSLLPFLFLSRPLSLISLLFLVRIFASPFREELLHLLISLSPHLSGSVPLLIRETVILASLLSCVNTFTDWVDLR